MNTFYPNQKPGLFTTIAVMTLTSGIINLFWGFIASATALGTFIGVVCLPLTILPTILGVFEIIYAAKLLSAQPEPVQPSQSIAVFEILTFFIGNIFSMVVGILARFIYPGEVQMGLILSAVLGVVGSFLAGFVGSMLDKEPGTQLKPAGFVYSILGAIAVIFVARMAGVA